MCIFKKKKEKVRVKVCNSWPDLPPEVARIATAKCPATHEAEYYKVSRPTSICDLSHEAPKPHIVDNPKPGWMPRMVVAALRLHYDSPGLTDEQLKSFAEKISLAGVDYIRIMGDWESYFTPGSGVSAFMRTASDRFDLDQENPEWDKALKRLRDIFDPYFIKIYFDLIDNCDSDKGPWAWNVNGFLSIYEQGLVTRYIKFFDRVFAVLGAEAKYGLGNEFQGDNVDWIQNCMLPLAEHIHGKAQKPICFSGDDMTAHHLHGALSPDVSGIFGIRDSCLVRHWCGTPAKILEFLDQGSSVRCYAYSDDGLTMESVASEHGPCTPANVFCQGTIQQRIDVVRAAWDSLRNIDNRMDHIEFLPREISWEGDPNNISEESLKIYDDLAQALWGLSIKREMEV